MKRKDPPGYPGDEVLQKLVGKTVRGLRLEKNLSLEEMQAFLDDATEDNPQPFLARALALVVRQLREAKKMSRERLSERSGLSLRFLNQLERAKKNDVTVIEIVRLAMGLEHSLSDLGKQIEETEERLKGKDSPDRAT